MEMVIRRRGRCKGEEKEPKREKCVLIVNEPSGELSPAVFGRQLRRRRYSNFSADRVDGITKSANNNARRT